MRGKLFSRIRVLFMFLVVVALFLACSSTVFGDDPPAQTKNPETEAAAAEAPAAPAVSAAGDSGGTSSFPRCVGGDLDRLSGTAMLKCMRFREQFERYAQETGLTAKGVDTLFLFITAAGESGCKSVAFGDEKASRGGIMQTIHACTTNPETNKCNTVDDEIRIGLEHFADYMDRVYKKGFTGRDAALMILLAFNRGPGPMQMTKTLMDEKGMNIADAAQEACGYYYSNFDKFPKRRTFCYDWVPKKYNCAGNKGDSVCDEGKSCAWWSGCFLDKENLPIPIHYSGSRWQNYEKTCENIGGQIVNQGAPIEQPAIPSEEGVISAPGYRPTHPYFEVPYSVNPSFSTSIPYDFSIYDVLPGIIHQLERCKDDVNCVAENVSIIEQEKTNFDWILEHAGQVLTRDEGILEYGKWEAFCESPEQHAVNSIAEAIDVCSRSQDRNCICSYVLPIPAEQEVDLGDSWWSGVSDLLGITAFMREERAGWEERLISFDKSGGNIRVSMSVPSGAQPQVIQNADFKEVESSIRGPSDKKLRYTPGDIFKVLHIYKDNNNNISIYPQFGAPNHNYCTLRNNVVKFCIVQNSSFLAYNQQEKKAGIQRMVLKFAYLFKSEVTDVRNFEVRDARFASNTSLLVWDSVEGANVNYYKVYYSDDIGMEANVRGKSPAELEPEISERLQELPWLYVEDKVPISMRVESLENPSCTVYGERNCNPVYELTSVGEAPPPESLYNNVLYYSDVDRVNRKFFYFLPGLMNDHRYFFAITAVDTNGDESPSFNIPESGRNNPSVDDIPPGLANVNTVTISGNDAVFSVFPPNENIDGSPLGSLIEYFKVFCFQDDLQQEFDLESKAEIARLVNGETMPMSDFQFTVPVDELGCGFNRSPQQAKIIVAGVKRMGGQELFFRGNVSSFSSAVYSVVVPTESG